MKFIYSFIILILLAIPVSAQNLVPNYGFEEFFSCPNAINSNKTNTKIAPHWNSPSYGTPDLYNRCSRYQMGTDNITGFTDPYSGDGFAGIIVWEGKKGFREYLQVKLKEPLKTDRIYVISFYYKLSSYSKYSSDRICFALSEKEVFYKQDGVLPVEATYCEIKAQSFDPYSGSWELLETEYTAKGGEALMIIGNFSDNSSTNTTHLSFKKSQEPMLEHAAYYYIDEVWVAEKKVRDTSLVDQAFHKKEIALDDTYILENVLFAHDSDILLPASYNELNQVVEILKKHPDWKIKISGHTDATGKAEYNQLLSERRAESVKKYFVSKGIPEKRMEAKGYGQSRPIVKEKDAHSQEKNRRVEVEFY